MCHMLLPINTQNRPVLDERQCMGRLAATCVFRISNEAIMQIRFLADAPLYRDSNLTVVFAALVDGEPVPCAISVEALEDHFGASPEGRYAWMRAFNAGRDRIEAVAREHLRISNGTPVLLKSGHFPPGDMIS